MKLFLLLLLTGCASSTDVQKMNDRIALLEANVQKTKEISLDAEDYSRQALENSITSEKLSVRMVELLEAYTARVEDRFEKLKR